jgi:hypothetical protein
MVPFAGSPRAASLSWTSTGALVPRPGGCTPIVANEWMMSSVYTVQGYVDQLTDKRSSGCWGITADYRCGLDALTLPHDDVNSSSRHLELYITLPGGAGHGTAGALALTPLSGTSAGDSGLLNRTAPPRMCASPALAPEQLVQCVSAHPTTPGLDLEQATPSFHQQPTPMEGVPEGRPSAWPQRLQKWNRTTLLSASPASTQSSLPSAVEGVPETRASALQAMLPREPRSCTWMSPSLTAIEGVPEAHASAWATAGLFPSRFGRFRSPARLPSGQENAPWATQTASVSPPSDAQGSISLDGASSLPEPACAQSRLVGLRIDGGAKAWYEEPSGYTPTGHCNRAVSADLDSGTDGAGGGLRADAEPEGHHKQDPACASAVQNPVGDDARAGALGLNGYDSGIEELYGCEGFLSAGRHLLSNYMWRGTKTA